MIKNILFDFGGVMIKIINWPVEFVENNNNLEKWYIFEKIKYVIVDYAKWLIDTFKFRKLLREKLWENLWEELFERWWHRENAMINTDMIKFVEELKWRWYWCYLLSDTNAIHKNSNEMRHVYDIFDERILSCDIGLCKREDVWNNTTKFFDYAIDKLDILPEESIFIDDLQTNCDVANRAWIKTILAKNTKQVIEDLSGILGLD